MGYAKGEKWDYDKVVLKVLEVKDYFGMDRMPTRTDRCPIPKPTICMAFHHNFAIAVELHKAVGFWTEVMAS